MDRQAQRDWMDRWMAEHGGSLSSYEAAGSVTLVWRMGSTERVRAKGSTFEQATQALERAVELVGAPWSGSIESESFAPAPVRRLDAQAARAEDGERQDGEADHDRDPS